MLFQVSMTVRIPHDVDVETVDRLRAEEHERAGELENQGKWLHVWRVVGKWANLSIFSARYDRRLGRVHQAVPGQSRLSG